MLSVQRRPGQAVAVLLVLRQSVRGLHWLPCRVQVLELGPPLTEVQLRWWARSDGALSQASIGKPAKMRTTMMTRIAMTKPMRMTMAKATMMGWVACDRLACQWAMYLRLAVGSRPRVIAPLHLRQPC